MKEIYKILEENKELRDRIRKMWCEDASTQEIAEAFKEAGFDIDPSEVEEALSTLQAGTAEKAAVQRLDLSDLERVSGGSYYEGDYYEGDECIYDDRCSNQFNCDETYYCPRTSICVKSDYAD